MSPIDAIRTRELWSAPLSLRLSSSSSSSSVSFNPSRAWLLFVARSSPLALYSSGWPPPRPMCIFRKIVKPYAAIYDDPHATRQQLIHHHRHHHQHFPCSPTCTNNNFHQQRLLLLRLFVLFPDARRPPHESPQECPFGLHRLCRTGTRTRTYHLLHYLPHRARAYACAVTLLFLSVIKTCI